MSEKIVIEERKELSITKVKEVESFCDKEIKLSLLDGVIATIKGEGLKIANFSKENGDFKLNGKIYEIKFADKKLSFLKRAIK